METIFEDNYFSKSYRPPNGIGVIEVSRFLEDEFDGTSFYSK
jgi:hypothetical protein